MNEVCIAIPSKGRSKLILEKTLNLLSEVESDIFIFVNEKEKSDYDVLTQIGKDNIIIVSVSNSVDSAAKVRKSIQEHLYDLYKYVWILDDNLEMFQKRDGMTASGKNFHLTTLNKTEIKDMFKEVLDIMKSKKYIQGTLSFRPSNWYCSDEIKENTRAWGVVLNDNREMVDNEIIYDEACPIFEDYDITAQCLQKGFKTFSSFNYVFHKNMGKYKGGCQTYRTEEMAKTVCEHLEKKYPRNVKIKLEKKRQMLEPLFNWKLLKKNKKQKRLF